jgi:outer membrane protein OmpA-like peptidoglycan-associated protein
MRNSISMWMKSAAVAIAMMVVAACATTVPPAPSKPGATELPFDAAVDQMTRELLHAVATDSEGLFGQRSANVVIDPFVDRNSGEVPRASRDIEKIMIRSGKRHHPGFKLDRLSPASLNSADYLIRGTIYPEPSQKPGKADPNRYRLRATVRSLRKVRDIGTSVVWMVAPDLDYAPTPAYRDNPLYMGRGVIASRRSSSPADKLVRPGVGDADALRLRALLTEAESLYDQGSYEQALSRFETALQADGGRTPRAYAGLYMCNRKLERRAGSASAFRQLVAFSIETYEMLMVKFLFDVNSAEFKPGDGRKGEYDLWIREIGAYFQESDYCIQIVGHSSRTGAEAWNRELSLNRAKNIQAMLKTTFPAADHRSRAVGRGFSENIVGTGTDDERDALDRRVEIEPIACDPQQSGAMKGIEK